MTTCPTCGTQNDPGNRFCDQCGTRLDAAPAAPGAVPPDQPTMAAPACPNCGETVLPGEAFCDNCGADLTATAPPAPAVVPADAPTMLASAPIAPPAAPADAPTMLASAPPAPPAPAAPPPTGTMLCPVCGQSNLPGERFCDNCGADLTAPAPVQPNDETILAPAPVAPIAPPPPGTADLPPVAAIEPAPPVAPAEAAPQPVAPPPSPPGTADLSPLPDAAETAEAAQPAAPEVTPAAPLPAADPGAERKALEDLAAAHRETVAQYEQMAGRYPAGSAPAFIAAGLDAAKAELAGAEAALANLAAPAPSGPDPVELARLEGLVAAHRETVAQYEQMAGRYPAGSAPAFITAGLDAAKAELAGAEAALANLSGGPAATPAAPAAPAIDPLATIPAPPAPAPAAPGPRLVIAEGGHVVALPTGRAEIIVGREDPVSSIFPEVDMTSFGGEAGGVSRQHAKITQSGGQWLITDLNSTNYTKVDGARLEPNVASPLHDGARVQFGRVVTTFHL